MGLKGGNLRHFETSFARKRPFYFNIVGISFLAALIAGILLFMIPNQSPTVEAVRQNILDIFDPLTEVLAAPVRGVQNIVQTIRDASHVYESNEVLKAENERLKSENIILSHYRQVLTRYEALQKILLPDNIDYVVAKITADLRGSFVHTYISDAGAENGLRSGHAALGENGLIGRVIALSDHSSRILLLTDYNSHIPIIIGDENIRAILSGDNSSYPVVQFQAEAARLDDGMKVFSSGDGGVILPGLPIGHVFYDNEGQPRVKLLQNLSEVDYIRILLTRPILPPARDIDIPTDLQVQ